MSSATQPRSTVESRSRCQRSAGIDAQLVVHRFGENRPLAQVPVKSPLPAGHPLWDLPNCIITPHTANATEMAIPYLRARVRENVVRFARGEELIGPVNVRLGY